MNKVNKLLKALNFSLDFEKDSWTQERWFISNNKKWIANILPYELC